MWRGSETFDPWNIVDGDTKKDHSLENQTVKHVAITLRVLVLRILHNL